MSDLKFKEREPLDHFWSKVVKGVEPPAHVAHLGDCWDWSGSFTEKGYGRYYRTKAERGDGRKAEMAHRFAYTQTRGEIPGDKQVDHQCHRPSCVQPAHLRLVTISENQQNRSGAQSNSGTGIRGVGFHKGAGKFRAYGKLDGRQVSLGYHDTPELAEAAIVEWRKEHYPTSILDQEVVA